ncbi:hypothetical protein ABTH88_19965, partial [Acinetobacter baumannii]
ANGGSVEDDDSYIAKALPINLNKWLKVKGNIMPFLAQHSPGYLTQDKLVEEYDYVSRKNSGNKLDASEADTPAAPRTVPPAASPTAYG